MALLCHIWSYAYGAVSLCAAGICRFHEVMINGLLGQDFMAMLIRIKSGGLNQQVPQPTPEQQRSAAFHRQVSQLIGKGLNLE